MSGGSRTFRFLHAADLHLGCSQFGLEERYADFFTAFEKIASLAIDKKVDALLLAGDIYHHRSIEAATLARSVDIFERLKHNGIAVIAIEGNHDKAYYVEKQSWLEYLAQRKLIVLLKPDISEDGCKLRQHDGESGSVYSMAGCRFIGFGFLGGSTSKRLQELYPQIPPCEEPTVILLHAGVDRLISLDLAGVRRDDIQPFADSAGYMALGHVHTSNITNDFAYNPGAPECVHLSEGSSGKKGCYLVEIQKEHKNVEFIEISRRPTFYIELDATDGEVRQQLAQRAEIRGAIGSVTITHSELLIDVESLIDWMKQEMGCLYVEIICKAAHREREQISTGDIAQLEREVLLTMLKERGNKNEDALTEFLISYKNELNAKAPPEDLFELISGGAVCT